MSRTSRSVGFLLLVAVSGWALAADLVRLEDGAATLRLRITDTGSTEFTTDDATSPALRVTQNGAGPLLDLVDGATTVVTVVDGGNVGIGTGSPGTRLEVAGQVRITGGGPASGRVLTSDASGLATWQALPPAGVPSGVIVMWSGTLATIPAGWALCDGTNGTPDLRDRFVQSVGTSENPGATGGSNTHPNALPSHGHSLSVSGGSHGHSFTSGSVSHGHSFTSGSVSHSHAFTSGSVSHSHSFGTNSVSHTHGFSTNSKSHTHPFSTGTTAVNHNHGVPGGTPSPWGGAGNAFSRIQTILPPVNYNTTNTTGNHSHSGTTGSKSHSHSGTTNATSHSHSGTTAVVSHGHSGTTVAVSHGHSGTTASVSHGHSGTTASVSHSHTGTSGSTGSTPTAIDNRPLYYKLAYLMKL